MASDAVMREHGRSVTQLYDSACELLFAAQELCVAADLTRERTARVLAQLSLS